MKNIDKYKFQLIGIAKFLEDETQDSDKGRRMAKAVLTRTVEKSETAAEDDKEEAKVELEELEGRMREASTGRLSNVIVMKNPNDLKILSGLERMQISLPDYNAMKENIKDHGVQLPVIITEEGNIIDGRHRWLAAKELGLVEIPTILNTETRLPEIVRLMLSYNVCRRQLTKEEKIHYIKVLRELGKSKKGAGRPCKDPQKLNKTSHLGQLIPSVREVAKLLNTPKSTIQRISKPPVKKEYDVIPKKFHIAVGKSKEGNPNFLLDIHKYLDEVYQHLELEDGSTVDVEIKITVGHRVEE